MTCGKCDVKYKSPEVSRLEQELAEVKADFQQALKDRADFKQELATLKSKMWGLQQMVNMQVEDEGLWLVTTNAVIAYLQQLEGVKIPYNVIVDYLEPMKQAVKED